MADIDDERYDAPEAPGVDVIIRGLSITITDDEVVAVAHRHFDGMYEFCRRGMLLGCEPA